MVLIDLGGYYNYYLLISFLGNQLSYLPGNSHAEVLVHACSSWTRCQPMYYEFHGRNKFSSSLAVLAVRVLVCHKDEELSGSNSKILPAPSSVLQPTLA